MPVLLTPYEAVTQPDFSLRPSRDILECVMMAIPGQWHLCPGWLFDATGPKWVDSSTCGSGWKMQVFIPDRSHFLDSQYFTSLI